MSFDAWPEHMVLPAGDDFRYGEWESGCGTKGCAWGWLCTAFDENDAIFLAPWKNSPASDSPAGQFARALAKELGAHMKTYDRLARGAGVKFALSDAFEHCGLPEDEVARRWRRAARSKDYTVDAGVFE